MYGVITCSRCKTVQGANLSHSRINCVRCRRTIDLTRAVVHFSTESPQELAKAIRRYSELKRGQDIPLPNPMLTYQKKESIESVISDLGKREEGFTVSELSVRMNIKEEDSEKLIDRFLVMGLLYEVKSGAYRLV